MNVSISSIKRLIPALCAVAGALAFAGHASAATYTWTAGPYTSGTGTEGSGTWDTTTANWVSTGGTNTTYDNTIADNVNVLIGNNAFANGTGSTITIAGGLTINVNNLTFNNNTNKAWVLAAAAGGSLNLSGTLNQSGDNNGVTISAPITGSGVVEATAATLTLTGSNSYIGPTIVAGGTIVATDGVGLPTASNLVVQKGTFQTSGTFTRSFGTGAGQIQLASGQTDGFAANAAATINLGGAGANLVWGSTNFNPSTFSLNASSGGANLTLLNGIDLNGANRTISNQANGSAATVTLAGAIINSSGTASVTFSLPNGSSNATIFITGSNTYNGVTTISGGSGTRVILSGNGSINNTSGIVLSGPQLGVSESGTYTIAVPISGSGNAKNDSNSLAINGPGAVDLAAINSFTNGTIINGGSLILDDSVNNGNRVATTGTLTMNGGNLTMLGNGSGSASQTVSATVIGASTVNTIVVTSTSGQSVTLNLGTLIPSAGGTVDFTLPSNGAIQASATLDTYGLLGGYATVSGTAYATLSSGNIVSYTPSNKNDVSTWVTGDNVSNTGAYINSLAANLTIGTLRFNAATSGTVGLGGHLLTVGDGGILETAAVGANSQFVTTGTLTSGTSSLTVAQNNTSGTLEIDSAIANSASTIGFTKTGAGTLILGGADTFTGSTTVSSGTAIVTGTLTGGTSATVASGATLQIGKGTASGALGSSVTSVTGAGTVIYNRPDTVTLGTANLISGGIALTQNGAGLLDITASQNYTGSTTINSGTMKFDTTTPLYGTGVAAPSLITINNGGTLLYNKNDMWGGSGSDPANLTITINAGGLLTDNNNNNNLGFLNLNGGTIQINGGNFQFAWSLRHPVTVTGTTTSFMTALSSANTGYFMLSNGGTVFNVANNTGTGGTDLSVSGILTDGYAAPATQTVVSSSLTKSGSGTMYISSTNTYTGPTIINGGILATTNLANGGTASGIGKAVNSGTSVILNGGTLQYLGTSATTDHLFSVGTSGGGLDASGVTGALVLSNTGAMGFNSQTGARTLTLTGSSTAANTLAAQISDNGGSTSLTKTGVGSWTLTGANNYTGPTTVNAGTLNLNNNNSGITSMQVNGGTLNLNGTNSYTGGTVVNTGGTIQFGGTSAATGSISINGGTLTVTNSNSIVGASSLSLSNAGTMNLAFGGTNHIITIAGTNGGASLSLGTDTLNYGFGNNVADELVLATGSTSLTGTTTITFTAIGAGQLSLTNAPLIYSPGGGLIASDFAAGPGISGASFTTGSNGQYLYLTTGVVVTTAYWKGTNSGNWSDTNNFTSDAGGATPLVGGITSALNVIFSATGQQLENATNVNTNISALSLTINDPGTVSIGGTGTLTIGAGSAAITTGTAAGPTTIGANVALTGSAPVIAVNNTANSLIISGTISGSNGLTAQGPGLLVLSGSNTYSGGTTLTGGTTQITNVNSLGALSGGVTFSGGSNSSLQLAPSIGSYSTNRTFSLVNTGTATIDSNGNNLTLGGLFTGSGPLNLTGGATVTFTAANTGYNGPITISSGTMQIGNGSTASSISAASVVNNTAIVFNSTGTQAFGASVTGTGAMIQSSNGWIQLTGSVNTPTYTVNSGTMSIESTATVFGGSSSPTGTINVNSGATFRVDKNDWIGGSSAATPAGLTVNLNGGTYYQNAAIANIGTLNLTNGGTVITNVGNSPAFPSISIRGPVITVSGTGESFLLTNNQSNANLNIRLSGTNNSSSDITTFNVGSTGAVGGIDLLVQATLEDGWAVNTQNPVATTFIKTGSGTMLLTGSNFWSGPTKINGGVLSLGNAGALDQGGAQSTTLASSTSATLISFGGGTLQYSASNTVDYSAQISSSNGQNVQIDTNGQTVTYATGLGGTTGSNLSFTLVGSGNGTMIFTGSNTYTGATLISPANTLQLGDGTTGHDGSILGTSGVTDNGTLAFNRFGTVSAGYVISGSGALTVSGPGMQILTATNTYSGATTINGGGTLQLGDGTTGDDGTIANTSGVIDNGTLIFNRFGSLSSGYAISGTGAVTVTGPGTQTLTGSSSYGGATTINASSTLQLGDGTAGHDGTIGGTSGVLDNGTLIFNRSGAVTSSYAISGSGSVVVSGTGSQNLSGNSNYSGSTTVNAGATLIVSGALSGSGPVTAVNGGNIEADGINAITNASSTVTLNGGELSGQGTVNNVVANGGTLAPGLMIGNSSSGTLTANGNVTLSGSTNFNIRIATMGGGTDSDSLYMNNLSDTVSLNGANLVLSIGSFMNQASVNQVYIIINGCINNDDGTAATEFSYGGQLVANGGTIYSGGYSFEVLYNSGGNGDAELEYTGLASIPEPETWAMVFAGAGTLLGIQRYRRRR